MIKVHIAFAITSAVEGFYPKNFAGFTSYHFESYSHALPLISLVGSMIASSFGMTKFFVAGPISIFPNERPLDGMFSYQFICVLLLNTMFGWRLVCIENAFFTTYRLENEYKSIYPNQYKADTRIDPLIPARYRIAVYLIPSFISFIINAMRLFCTGQDLKQYVRKYPQMIIACCFTPFMFEGCKGNNIRVWKYGSLFNALFIGCFPQIVLLAMDFYRGSVSWDFIGNVLNWEKIFENNDALFKYSYGNSIFAIISGSFFLLLILLTIFTNKVIIDHEVFFKVGMKPPCLSSKTVTNSYKIKSTVESPNDNNNPKHVEQCSIAMHGHFKRKINYNKKKTCNDGNIQLKKVICNSNKHTLYKIPSVMMLAQNN